MDDPLFRLPWRLLLGPPLHLSYEDIQSLTRQAVLDLLNEIKEYREQEAKLVAEHNTMI